jgi:hypothetical protein
MVKDTEHHAVQKRFPAWFKQERPASAMQELVIDWHVPLADLQRLVEQQLQKGPGVLNIDDISYVWQGRGCSLFLEVAVEVTQGAASSAATATLGKSLSVALFIAFKDWPGAGGATCKHTATGPSNTAETATCSSAAAGSGAAGDAGDAAAEQATEDGSDPKGMCDLSAQLLVLKADSSTAAEHGVSGVLEAGRAWGDAPVYECQEVGGWQQVEQALRDANIVTADNTVHVRAIVEAME